MIMKRVAIYEHSIILKIYTCFYKGILQANISHIALSIISIWYENGIMQPRIVHEIILSVAQPVDYITYIG